MEVYLDDIAYEPRDSRIATVADLVAEIRPTLTERRRLIVSIACDRDVVPESEIESFLQRRLDHCGRLDLASTPVADLARDALAACTDLLRQSRPLLEQVAADLAGEQRPRALDGLQRCITAWAQVHAGLVQAASLLDIDLETLPCGSGTVPETLSTIAHHLTQLKECLEQRDFVLLADIVQYEILPSFTEWEAMIQVVQDRIPPS